MRTPLLTLALFAAAACSDANGPTTYQVEAARSRWRMQQIHDYQYLYSQSGFYTNISDRIIRVLVLADTVRAAHDTLTGDSLSTAGGAFPSVDGLFELAISGIDGGILTTIRFDRNLSYPTRLDLAGSPDATGSIFASEVQALLTASSPRSAPH